MQELLTLVSSCSILSMIGGTMKDILFFLVVAGIDYLLVEFPLRKSKVFSFRNMKGTLAGYSVVVFSNSLFCLITGSVRICLILFT